MHIFEPVELTWRGVTYVIPPKRVLNTVAQVEEVLTLNDLSRSDRVPLARLSQAYAILLRCAGCPVADEEVYAALWTADADNAQTMILMLLNLMVPRSIREKLPKPEAGEQPKPDSPSAE